MESTANTNNRETPASVPYVVYRDAIDDNRWVVKKLVVALIVAIALMFISNMAWLWYWNQFDYTSEVVTTTADSEGEGMAVNITGGNGGVTNHGQSDSDNPKDYQDETFRLGGDETSNQDTEEVNTPG